MFDVCLPGVGQLNPPKLGSDGPVWGFGGPRGDKNETCKHVKHVRVETFAKQMQQTHHLRAQQLRGSTMFLKKSANPTHCVHKVKSSTIEHD